MRSGARWQVGDARWNAAEQRLVEDIFRRYVRTPSRPRGRIRRETCPFCKRERRRPPSAARTEFHHLSYRNPFRGVWTCYSHHRKIEHGSTRVRAVDVWDYASLVPPARRKRYAEQVARAHRTKTYARQRDRSLT